MQICPVCKGGKTLPEFNEHELVIREVPCPECGGSGEVPEDGDDPPQKWAMQEKSQCRC